jgi:hypothetical protein
MAETAPKLLVDVAGVVEAPVDQVWPLLRRAIPFTEENGTTAAHQGGWWYRGEWSAQPDGNRTLVTHRVYNVAPAMRWGVPLANRFFIGFARKTRDGLQRTIIEISQELGTNGYLTPGPLPKHPRRRR